MPRPSRLVFEPWLDCGEGKGRAGAKAPDHALAREGGDPSELYRSTPPRR